MPEFEEPAVPPSSKENYTPSTDATRKPRTRRRSGGFKTGYAASEASIGEVEAAEALKKEKLSGATKPEPKPKKAKKSAPKADKPERKKEKTSAKVGNAQPNPETLAAIERVEARIAERKKERDARRAEKGKTRSGKSDRKPSGPRSSSGKKPRSGGLINSILSFFGLGPKPPAKKRSGQGKPSGSRGPGSRPRSKSGSSGGGGSRGPDQKRRGNSKGRRSGSNGPRRSDRSSQEKQS